MAGVLVSSGVLGDKTVVEFAHSLEGYFYFHHVDVSFVLVYRIPVG